MTGPARYRVETRVGLVKLGPRGEWTNDRMSFEDNVDVGDLDFAGIADLLLQFHNVAQSVAAAAVPAEPESGSGP